MTLNFKRWDLSYEFNSEYNRIVTKTQSIFLGWFWLFENWKTNNKTELNYRIEIELNKDSIMKLIDLDLKWEEAKRIRTESKRRVKEEVESYKYTSFFTSPPFSATCIW